MICNVFRAFILNIYQSMSLETSTWMIVSKSHVDPNAISVSFIHRVIGNSSLLASSFTARLSLQSKLSLGRQKRGAEVLNRVFGSTVSSHYKSEIFISYFFGFAQSRNFIMVHYWLSESSEWVNRIEPAIWRENFGDMALSTPGQNC